MARKSTTPNAPDTASTEPEMPETQGPHDPRAMFEPEASPSIEAAPAAETVVEAPAPVAEEPAKAEPEAEVKAPEAIVEPPAPEPVKAAVLDVVVTEKPWSKVRVITATTVAWNGCMLKLAADDVLDASGYGPGFIQALRDSGVPLENLS